jgi:hypothetical protein
MDGLEYEDSYIHKSAARYQLAHGEDPSEGFFIRTCVAGSISRCRVAASFGTHVVGFSALISGIARLIGYSARLGNVLSGVCWLVTVHCLWSLLKAHVAHPFARIVGLGVFLCAPAMYVISASGFAEPLFGALMMFCVWQFMNPTDIEKERGMVAARLAMWSVSLMLLALSKKEGLLFIGLVAVWGVIQAWQKRADGEGRAQSYLWAGSSIAALLICVGVFDLLEAAARHSQDIGQAAFSLRFISRTVAPLLGAGVTPAFFGVVWIGFGVSLIFVKRCRDARITLVGVSVTGYLFLYLIHARHYWFTAGQDVQAAEMVRYLYALTAPACLVTASIMSALFPRLLSQSRPNVAALGRCGVVFALCIGVIGAQMRALAMKADIARDELISWRNSLEVVASSGSESSVFISSRTAALYAYVDDSVELVDFVAVGDPRLRTTLTQLKSERSFVFLDSGMCFDVVVRSRWAQACETSRSLAE